MPEAAAKNGWTRVAFGDVVRQVRDRVDPEESGLARYVAGEHMDTDDLRIRRWGSIGDGYLGPAFHMRFRPGHVLYGSRRTYLRKVAVAEFEGITANTTFVLEPKNKNVLLPELLPFVMRSESFHEHSIKQSKGSVNPYINFSDLTWYEFVLPPPEEQRRIATALWAAEATANGLFRCAEAAESVILSAGVDLLALRGFSTSGNATQKILPTGWASVDGASVFTAMSGDGEPLPDPNGDLLFLKVADFNRNESELHLVTAETRFQAAANLGRRLFEPGTVVFPKRGASIFLNKAGVLRVRAAVDPNLMALVPREDKIDPEFLYWCVKCIGLWRFADTTSTPQLNHKHLIPMRIPLPPLQQQRHIAMQLSAMRSGHSEVKKRLDSLRSVEDQLLATTLAGTGR